MNRLARLTTVVTTLLATMALSVPAALAYGPPRPAGGSGTQTIPAPAVIHTTSTTGVGAWTVLLIALGAVVVGALVAEAAHMFSRHHRTGHFATA
jgi:hypothetical protein